MEATLLGKALASVLAALVAVYALILRPWRPRRMWARRVPAIDLLLVVSAATGAAALYWPLPFERTATVLVHQTDLPETLAVVDARIREIEELPERIWSDLTARLGWTSEPPVPTPPETGPGPVTGAVLPALTGVVEVIVRAFVYWSSLLALATCIVMRLVVGVTRAVVAAAPRSPRQTLLEGRIAELEELVVTLRTKPPDPGPDA